MWFQYCSRTLLDVDSIMIKLDSDAQIVHSFLASWGLDDALVAQQLTAFGQKQSYSKSATIVAAGDLPASFGIIISGLVRYYYSSPEGKSWNKAFYKEGQLVTAASAYLTQTPSPFTIETLEPTELLSFPYAALIELERQHPSLVSLRHNMMTYAFIRNEQREAMLLTKNAEQRFRWLLDNEADLIERVSQFHLASYIGIDAVSFSRIKTKARISLGTSD